MIQKKKRHYPFLALPHANIWAQAPDRTWSGQIFSHAEISNIINDVTQVLLCGNICQHQLLMRSEGNSSHFYHPREVECHMMQRLHEKSAQNPRSNVYKITNSRSVSRKLDVLYQESPGT